MTTGATAAAVTAVSSTVHPEIRAAGRVVLVATAFGLVAQLLLFDVGAGINIPITMALVLLAGWVVRRRRTPDLIDAWLAPASAAFAAFAALRADPTLVGLDVLASITLGGAALASFSGRRVVSRTMSSLVSLAAATIGWIASGAVPAIAQARRTVPTGAALGRRASPAMPVLRGTAIAIPVVLVFVALFSSADAVFARMLDDLFGLELELDDAVWRLVMAAVLAWLAAGGLALAASTPRERGASVSEETARRRIGTTEILTVLVAVDLVFATFVSIQAAYLFGGLDTLHAAGMTYAAYARRGFFELVAVTILAGGLAVAADRLASARTRGVVMAAMALTALTAVVLVSASLRLRLYQEAYGWTELRLYVVATMAVLAVGLVGLLVALATDRVRWIGHVVVVATLVVGLGLNVVGPVRFITEQNVARVLDPALVPSRGSSGLDTAYVASLGDDAVPALIQALPHLDGNEAGWLAQQLAFRREELQLEPGLNAWQAWNAGREAARDALEAAAKRGDLAP